MVEVSSHLIRIHEHILLASNAFLCLISAPKAVPTGPELSQPDAKPFVQLLSDPGEKKFKDAMCLVRKRGQTSHLNESQRTTSNSL